VGYLPRRDGELRAVARELASWPWPVVAFESPRRLALARGAGGRDADRQAAVCRELTKRYEEVIRAPLGELAARFEEPPRGGSRSCSARPAAGNVESTWIRPWRR
jgi:16S rRNA (cytidine1402-2'-O)-methyltransferase